ncbi:hypothetical protein DYB32_002319 [Aphanomyces invadans]|uniref:Protein kinase domain-containing protein n=1 Tax=Aphanomyces invadans TaxID=157072 RepID=A0A3R6W188_9STRA|nr:hypothetical protein DYB32_002319 [Aphanomyces invadans]
MATTEKKTKEKRPQGKRKQTWRKVTKKIKKPVKKPVRKAKRQRGRSATKNAKPSNGNPDTMRGASPTLITQDEYIQVQSMKDKNANDSHITTFFGTCQEGLSLTRCTERSTKKSFLCVTTLNKLGDDCTIHYVRPRGTRGDTTTSKYYSIEVDEAPGERGLLVEDINVPLLVDELPANTSLMDLFDCSVTTITSDFSLPPSLQVLVLSRNNITTFPSALVLSPKLTHLHLSENPLMDFKVNQDGFKRLQALAHFSADTQNMECDPGTEKKLVANTSMYAGMWSDRPVVLQPLQASNPPATLQILASLSHPNIVSLYGITWSNDMVVSCVVERCPRNLQTFLSSDERIPLATKLAIAADVATALLFLHSMHVVHDRLSDTQVFIMDNGTAKVNFPRVTAPSRWSTASDTEEGGETKDYDVWAVEAAHRLVWTSPERLSNDEDLAGDNESRCKADVYALGILISTLERQSLPGNEQQRSEHAVGVVAEALRGDTSRRRRMSVVEHCPDVEWFTPQCPAPLRALITKCLHVFPPDRPTSMDVACQLREMARQAAATK